MIRDGIKSIASCGVCPETDWPYDINQFSRSRPEGVFGRLDIASSYFRV